MEHFRWNPGKNTKLKTERGVSFEGVVDRIEKGAFKLVKNRSKNHPRQKCFVVTMNGKLWLVPFKEYRHHYFLHTIFEVKK